MKDMRFRGRYWFLSNFYEHEIVTNESRVPTLEHAFQMSKTADSDQMMEVAKAATPGDAKRLGRKVTLLPDWN